jgi:transposase
MKIAKLKMPIQPQLTDTDKGKILAYAESLNANQIAQKIGRNPTTIRRFLAKYKRTGKIENHLRSGRPSILTNEEKDKLISVTTKEQHKPLHEIINKAGLICSLTTARRVLKKVKLHSCVAAKKPYISEKNIEARIKWCNEHKNKTIGEWKKIIFSDEASVEIGKKSRQIRVWRYPGERFKNNCLTPTFKSGRKSLMVWGCFAGKLKGPLVFIDEYKEKDKKNITANSYIEILEKNLLPFLHKVRAATHKVITFQQDNASIHTAKITEEWLETKKIKTIDWPANSPDLNPIENIWKLLKDNVQKHENFPRTINELKVALKEEWDKFDINILNNIIISMPKRINAVLEADGKSTKY